MDEYTALGILAGAIGFVSIFAIAIYVLTVIALWKIFTKAGEDGWKAIIPIYNMYILYKISWETKFFWIYLAIQCVSVIISGITANGGNGFLAFLSFACSIAALVLTILMNRYLARSYGQGIGFTVGLVLLNTIFTLILGFSSYAYEGNGAELVAADKANLNG